MKRSRFRDTRFLSRSVWRTVVVTICVLSGVILIPVEISAQTLLGLRMTRIFATAMPVWMYNGFMETADGDSIPGSEVSPIRMSIGAGVELRVSERLSLEPQSWLFMQEYAALHEHDKTVPTQIETGGGLGDIANTIGVAISVPLAFTMAPEWAAKWEFRGSLGPSLIYRIPISGIDGSKAGPVGRYWIAGRFIYPTVGFSTDYRVTDRVQAGAGITWYVPVYNAWAGMEDTPFLDETMVRYGLRVRWYTAIGDS